MTLTVLWECLSCLHVWSFYTLLILHLLSVAFYFCFLSLFVILASAGDISGAVQTLQALLLFYPSDQDSLDNLQLYSETLGGDTESRGSQASQVHLQTMQYFWQSLTLNIFFLNYAIDSDNFRSTRHVLMSFYSTGHFPVRQTLSAGEEAALLWDGEPRLYVL